MERRANNRNVEIIDSSGANVITGYSAVFYRAGDPDTQFEISPGVFERIMPGAFDRAIREDDVYALFNHQESEVLGRNKAGTCKLTVDDIGLHYEARLPDTQTARDVKTLIDRGEVTGSSFAFEIGDENRRFEDNAQILEITEVKPLFDVGPVTFPAYRATTAQARKSFSESRQQSTTGNNRRAQVAASVGVTAAEVIADIVRTRQMLVDMRTGRRQ